MLRGFSWPDANVMEYNGALWVPPPLRLAVIRAAHHKPPNIHRGSKACFRELHTAVNWRDIRNDITAYIKSCLFCQQVSSQPSNSHFNRQPMDPDTIFSRIHTDIWSTKWHVTPQQEKKISCLTLIDSFSHFVEVFPLRNTKEETILAAFLFGWAARYGWPRIIVTDNATNLSAGVFAQTLQAQGVRFCSAAPFYPQGNSLIERVHRALNHHLRIAKLHQPVLPFYAALGLHCSPSERQYIPSLT